MTATIFVVSFTAGALLHRHTVLASLLCGVAIVTLVSAVVAANARSRPRQAVGMATMAHCHPRQPNNAPSAGAYGLSVPERPPDAPGRRANE